MFLLNLFSDKCYIIPNVEFEDTGDHIRFSWFWAWCGIINVLHVTYQRISAELCDAEKGINLSAFHAHVYLEHSRYFYNYNVYLSKRNDLNLLANSTYLIILHTKQWPADSDILDKSQEGVIVKTSEGNCLQIVVKVSTLKPVINGSNH